MNFFNPKPNENEDTSNNIRERNKTKAKNLMNIAVSFNDEETLQKIQDLFLSLPPEKMMAFKEYLNDRKFLKRSNHGAEEQQIINQIVEIATTSVPKNKFLKKIYNTYTKNLNTIEELKIKMAETHDCRKLNIMMAQIDEYNEKNIKLLSIINDTERIKKAV